MRSKDGIDRQTFVVRVRLTREEVEKIQRLLRRSGRRMGLREWLDVHIQFGIEAGIETLAQDADNADN